VTPSPAAPTFRAVQFGQLVQIDELLIKRGHGGLPVKYLIEASDAPQKEKILSDIEEAEAAQAAQVKQAAQPEMAGAR